MNDYDKAGRYLVKRDPEGVLGWVLGVPDLGFVAWLDARRVPLPDQGDLTHDLIAACRDGDATEAYCLELQAKSSAGTVKRVLYGYVPGLLAEGGGTPLVAVGGVVVNFAGRAKQAIVRQAPRRVPACRLEGGVHQKTLSGESAAAAAADIEAGRASVWLLGWLPLMHGGAEPGILQAWRRAASRLPDERDRGVLAALTLTFSTLAKNRPAWERGLEGFNAMKSPFLEEMRELARKEARAEGRAEGRAEAIREVVAQFGQQRFGKPTKKQRAELDALTDLPRLERLRDRLLTAATWTDLLATP